MPGEPKTDHDLLIELSVELRGMRQDIKDLKDSTKDTVKDHEDRIRWLENRGWFLTGAAVVLSTIVNWAISLYKS